MTALKACEDPEEAASLIFDFSHELSFIGGNSLLPLFFASFKDLVTNLWVRFASKYGAAALAESAEQIFIHVRTATKTPPSAISRTPPTKVLTAAARSIRRHRFRSE